MSVKGSGKKIKLSAVFPIFIIATVAAVILRTWQAFNIIESDTGFFSTGHITIPILYAILVVAAIAIYMAAYVTKKVPEPRISNEKSISLGITCLLMCGGLGINAVDCFYTFTTVYSQYTPFSSMAGSGLASYLLKTGATPRLIEMIFAILSIIWFIILATKFFSGTSDVSKRKFFALCPVFWSTFRIVQRFTRTISFVNVSDLLLELFMIAFMMLFFLFFAQVSSNINARAVMNKVYAYGLIAAMTALVISVPKVIIMFAAPELSVNGCPLEACNITTALFIIAFLAVNLRVPSCENITVKQAEKERKEQSENTENAEN